MLDLQKLKTFQVVAVTNNFTRAAAELGCSQSSVTTHNQALERELGAPLFDRVAKGVVLTEVGRRTLEYAGRLIALADEAKAAVHMHGEVSGPLSVSAPEALVTYRLPEVLRQFQSLYPQIQLTLISRSDSQKQIDEVVAGTADLAVIVEERVHSSQLTTSRLWSEEILILKAPDYDFIAAEGFELEDIATVRVLLTDHNLHVSVAIRACPERGRGLARSKRQFQSIPLQRHHEGGTGVRAVPRPPQNREPVLSRYLQSNKAVN